MRQLSLLLLIVCCLTACQQSPRKNYYLFSVPSTDLADTSVLIDETIGVGPVEVAEYLNRLHIAYQADDGRLVMPNNSYWAEPIDKGIARALAANLTQQNARRHLITFPWRGDSKPRYSLRVQVHSLDREDNKATMNVTWGIIDNEQKQLLQQHRFIRSTAVEAGTKALVQGYSQLIAHLAVEIDHALSELAPRSDAP